MATPFSAHHVNNKPPRSFPFGIVLICLLFLSFLLWSKRDRITQIFTPDVSISHSLDDSGFVVGESITLEGEIRGDGDFVTHTHTLLTQSSGVFGLKSKTVNLNQYSGTIAIDGTVAIQHSGLVIIEVLSVMDLTTTPLTGNDLSLSGLVTTGDIITTGLQDQSTGSEIIIQNAVSIVSGTKTVLPVQAGVEEFPITIGTGIIFTSSRGHSILFPSKKISFESMSLATTDFGIKGLRCYSQMNVVDYPNKALINDAPAVKIYECTNKGFTLPSQFASISLDDGRVFLIEATNPAWINFANAIEISIVAAVTN